MLIEDWMEEEGLTKAGAGRRLGLKSRASVGRIIAKREACPEVVRRIYRESGGRVTPNDVFGLPVSEAAA